MAITLPTQEIPRRFRAKRAGIQPSLSEPVEEIADALDLVNRMAADDPVVQGDTGRE